MTMISRGKDETVVATVFRTGIEKMGRIVRLISEDMATAKAIRNYPGPMDRAGAMMETEAIFRRHEADLQRALTEFLEPIESEICGDTSDTSSGERMSDPMFEVALGVALSKVERGVIDKRDVPEVLAALTDLAIVAGERSHRAGESPVRHQAGIQYAPRVAMSDAQMIPILRVMIDAGMFRFGNIVPDDEGSRRSEPLADRGITSDIIIGVSEDGTIEFPPGVLSGNENKWATIALWAARTIHTILARWREKKKA